MSEYRKLIAQFLERYEKPVVEEYIQGFSGIDPQRIVNASELDHEQLSGLLGGEDSGHFHLTNDLLNKLKNIPAEGVAGPKGDKGDKGEPGSDRSGFSGSHEDLPGLLGGEDNGHYHLTKAQYVWQCIYRE